MKDKVLMMALWSLSRIGLVNFDNFEFLFFLVCLCFVFCVLCCVFKTLNPRLNNTKPAFCVFVFLCVPHVENEKWELKWWCQDVYLPSVLSPQENTTQENTTPRKHNANTQQRHNSRQQRRNTNTQHRQNATQQRRHATKLSFVFVWFFITLHFFLVCVFVFLLAFGFHRNFVLNVSTSLTFVDVFVLSFSCNYLIIVTCLGICLVVFSLTHLPPSSSTLTPTLT